MSDKGSKKDPNDTAKLPRGWSRFYSKSNKRFYYVHSDTKHTQWHYPTASEVADPLKAKRRADMNKEQERKRMEAAPVKRQRISDPTDFLELADTTCVAIIVPFRDLHPSQKRGAHLQQFVPHMIQFLRKLQGVSDFHIYIVEQSEDGRKFNRGKLLNIGFDLARKASSLKHDVFIFHDVDLLPQDDLEPAYSQFPKTPLHIARVWDRYSNNPKYFGGVVSFSASDFKRINGFPNNFWGWGGEDDEMKNRLDKLGIQFDSPLKGTLVDLEGMTLKEKLDFLRANREWKCMVKWEALDEHEKTWKTNGLTDLRYKVLKQEFLDKETKKATKVTVDVQLNGTHWSNDKCGLDYLGDS